MNLFFNILLIIYLNLQEFRKINKLFNLCFCYLIIFKFILRSNFATFSHSNHNNSDHIHL